MKDEILLKLRNIHVNYDGVVALDGIDLDIDEGEMIALMGPNGAGKSTIFKAIFGLVQYSSGEIFWHGQKITPRPHEIVERGISFVPQGRQIFKSLSVRENLEVGGMLFHKGRKRLIEERINSVVALFPNLKTKLQDKASTLSGGQQQMLSLARGLMTDPKVLLLDEPSLGLSPKITKDVFQKITEINKSQKIAVAIVEHNIKSVLGIVSRAYILDKGKMVFSDIPERVLDSNILEDVFMGKVNK